MFALAFQAKGDQPQAGNNDGGNNDDTNGGDNDDTNGGGNDGDESSDSETDLALTHWRPVLHFCFAHLIDRLPQATASTTN